MNMFMSGDEVRELNGTPAGTVIAADKQVVVTNIGTYLSEELTLSS